MSGKPIKIPGPDHPISIEKHSGRIVVKVAGQTIADTGDALVLREASYPPVFYVPRRDAVMTVLVPSNHQTYCPYKGEASYFSIVAGGCRADDAVWSYEAPHVSARAIRDHLAFYPDRVDSIEELES